MNYRAEVPGYVDLFELHKHDPVNYPFLLQSVAGHPLAGRYDILFAFPQQVLQAKAGADFFAQLTRQFEQLLPASGQGQLPFAGGWFLLLGYEAAGLIEPQLRLPCSPFSLPDALAVRCPAAAIYDRERHVTHLIAEHDPAQLKQLSGDLKNYFKNEPYLYELNEKIIENIIEEEAQKFIDGVAQIQQYLGAGDIFQANLSRSWRAVLSPSSGYLDIYPRLRRHNPAPFAGLARWKECAVLSSSPERLVRISNGIVETRPIAGTRPRGTGAEHDQLLRNTLIGSLKERAEHVMLIDLERNDLGRVCRPGSVEVDELMTIETYAHVQHIVSNVRGTLRAGIGPGAVLEAVFPGGTITGCPKIRAMQIIAELEGVGRGPYTGAMGYLSRCGRLDTNILIRSMVCEQGSVTFRAGAGVVADSDAQAELAETRAKARGLLLALGQQP